MEQGGGGSPARHGAQGSPRPGVPCTSDSSSSGGVMPINRLSANLAELQKKWPEVKENPDISRLYKVDEG